MADFCNKWYLMCNFDKTKFMIFQNGGKLKSRECWYMNRQKLKEVKEITYLVVKLKKMDEWKRHKQFFFKETPTGALYYSNLVIYTNKPFVSNLICYC